MHVILAFGVSLDLHLHLNHGHICLGGRLTVAHAVQVLASVDGTLNGKTKQLSLPMAMEDYQFLDELLFGTAQQWLSMDDTFASVHSPSLIPFSYIKSSIPSFTNLFSVYSLICMSFVCIVLLFSYINPLHLYSLQCASNYHPDCAPSALLPPFRPKDTELAP